MMRKVPATSSVLVRLALCALSSLGAACEQLIVLGSDCPQQVGDCTPERSSDEDASGPTAGEEANELNPMGLSALDGGIDEAAIETLDASPLDASIVWQLALKNPGFERNGGLGGDVLIGDYLSKFGWVPPIGWVWADLSDWHTCKPFSVNSVSDSIADAGVPLHQGAYLSFVPNGVYVRQKLTRPMHAGTTYFLRMNVLSRPDHGGQFRAQVLGALGNNDCEEAVTRLGSSEVIPEGVWTQTCVAFTANEDYSYFLLGVLDDDKASDSARLRIDSLEQVASCRGL